MFYKLSTKSSVQMARICVWDHRSFFLCIVMLPTSHQVALSIFSSSLCSESFGCWACNSMVNSCKLDFQTTVQVSDHDHVDYIALCSDHPLEIEPPSLKLCCLYLMVSYLKLWLNLGFQNVFRSIESTEFEFEAIICSLNCVDKASDPLENQSTALDPRKSHA